MALIAEYDADTGKLDMLETELVKARDGKGRVSMLPQQPRRKRRWTVVVTYNTPDGPQELTVKPDKKCYLAQISQAIDAAIREDAAKTGWVRNIKWKATGL